MTLAGIARTYVEFNKLNIALVVANKIDDSPLKAYSLKDIAEGYVNLNQFDNANNLLNKAKDIANKLEDSDSKKAYLLDAIADISVKIN